MMDVIEWPLAAGRITVDDLHLSGTTLSSGGVFGPGTVIHVENRTWQLSVSLPPLLESDYRKIRAVLDEARGQFGRIRVPIHTRSVPEGTVVPEWSDGAIWSGGAVWGGISLLSATVYADTPAGATVLRLSGGAHSYALLSMPFTIGDHLYRVSKISGAGLTFNPPLRRAVDAGAPVEFQSPSVIMRLAADNASLPVAPANLASSVTLNMVEAL